MDFRGMIREWRNDLTDMIFPHLCEACGTPLTRGEELICTRCRYELPRCRIHTEPFNILHQRIAGHAPIERAAAYFYYYRQSRHATLIHSAKYRGRPRIAAILARNMAEEIAPDGFFDGIDIIVPVPMHRLKELRRGYNQSRVIAAALGKATGIEVGDALVATRRHGTQTRRGPYLRWLNSRGIYAVTDASILQDKHVLVVDDVVTTGATLLACCEAIHRVAPSATISVLTLALTEQH